MSCQRLSFSLIEFMHPATCNYLDSRMVFSLHGFKNVSVNSPQIPFVTHFFQVATSSCIEKNMQKKINQKYKSLWLDLVTLITLAVTQANYSHFDKEMVKTTKIC